MSTGGRALLNMATTRPEMVEDAQEIARQNQITKQILQNYLERKLFPNINRRTRIPTVSEILPQATNYLRQHDKNGNLIKDDDRGSASSLFDDYDDGSADTDINDSGGDSLQSVESEHFNSIYDGERPGRFIFITIT